MSRFDQRLEQDLGHIADKATPSPTAWESIQSRIADQADEPEMEIIMLQPDPPKTVSRSTWVLTAAAAVVFIVGGVIFALQSDDDTSSILLTDTTTVPTPDTAVPPTTASIGATTQVTEPPTPTSVPDYLVGDPRKGAIDSFVAAFNAGDAEAISAMLTPEAEFGSTMLLLSRSVVPVSELDDQVLNGFLRFLADRHAELSITTCEAQGEQIACFGRYSDDVTSALPDPPRYDTEPIVHFGVDADDRLTFLNLTPNPPAGLIGGYTGGPPGSCRQPCSPNPWVTAAGYTEFLAWLDATYPDERAVLMDDNLAYVTRENPTEEDFVYGSYPRFEARDLWTQRVDEWLESLAP